MSLAGIQFNAAGWQGIIGEDFTFGRVRSLSAAFAQSVSAPRKRPTFLVAYDTHFLSDEFAQAAAAALESRGARAFLADRPMPAPAVSFEILRRRLAGGIYLGAGDAPGDSNGLQFFNAEAAPESTERLREIERLAGKSVDEEFSGETGSIKWETFDATEHYFQQIANLVRLDAIRRAGIGFAIDLMHGAGAGWIDRLLVAAGVPIQVLNQNRDVLFDGGAPDPSPANLERLAEAVRATGAALGLATGGDGRRFGILDNVGCFVPPGVIVALVYDYLVESRGRRLGVARGSGDWRMLEAVAHLRKLPVHETRVGPHGLASLLAKEKLALAVDANGGITTRGHVPESDGILACLLVAEMVAERGPLDGQLKKLIRRVGGE